MDRSSREEQSAAGWIRQHRAILLIAGPLAMAAIALVLYAMDGRYVSTDDAYVQIAKVEVSANISARLGEIDVRDNQRVKAGTVLLKLESGPYEIGARQAEAQLAGARLKIQALKAAYRERLADQKAAQDSLNYQQGEFARQTKLEQSGISSRAQLERSQNDLAAARQKLQAAEAQSESAFAELGGDPNAPVDSQPGVRQAQAALDRARLDLAYTVLRAPIDGVVAKVEDIQVGSYVQAAAPLFALVSDKDVWVEANFKETDLADIHPGQKAEFSVDAYPAETFRGRVESASPGTGSSFSLLPPENASGNWVKVVQRLPVRLSIERGPPDKPLAAGMSVVVTVDTGRRRRLWPWN